MARSYIIPVFIPHLGCPNDCVFCNQKFITDKERVPELSSLIEEHLGYFPENGTKVELAFFGGSFTGIDRDQMLKFLNQTRDYTKSGQIQALRISTRPDYIDGEILDILAQYQVETIELGVQSTDPEVLRNNQRYVYFDSAVKASRLIKERGFKLGLQMMVDMDGSPKEADMKTARDLASLEPDFVRIYPTQVLPDTELEERYRKGAYKPIDDEELIIRLMDLVLIFEAKSIPIARLGLYSDGKKEMSQHPALKQDVYSRLYSNMIVKSLADQRLNEVYIYASSQTLNYASGYKSYGRRALENLGIATNYRTRDLPDGVLELEYDGIKKRLDFKEEAVKYEAQGTGSARF